MSKKLTSTKEFKRLNSFKFTDEHPYHPWLDWGPYVSERSWGTVREDYSENGDAWEYLTFDKAHTKAYRWAEDGIAGLSDRFGMLALVFSFWNHKDPILKERLFGLTSPEGNHGEDVKECYWHLDATPSYSYARYLYKYPHAEFPYDQLRVENAKRTTKEREYELIDTGVFDDSAYFDIFIEMAKAAPEDISIRVEIINRGREKAQIDFIPQLICRNRWSWEPDKNKRPVLRKGREGADFCEVIADFRKDDPIFDPPYNPPLKKYYIYGDGGAELLFTENDTVDPQNWNEIVKEPPPYGKDAFHRKIIHGEDILPKDPRGTKAAFHYKNIELAAGGSKSFSLRLTTEADEKTPLVSVRPTFLSRREECDDFYAALSPEQATEEERAIQRSALSGLLWSKHFYNYHVNKWLIGDDPSNPLPEERLRGRNSSWRHLFPRDIMFACDKWEYPWFAGWDHAFQSVALSLVNLRAAKEQVWLMFTIKLQHPNGAIPACEWDFSDLNPPLLSWAALQIYLREEEVDGEGDRDFLSRCFHKSLMQFSWWVNRVDSEGKNVFEGGFLGLDNINLFDRSSHEEGDLEQSDGTGWMGVFCLVMMKIALRLSQKDHSYEPLAVLFFHHFVYIKQALQDSKGHGIQMWNEEDGFFYDVLCDKQGQHHQMRIRSMVGMVPLFAVHHLSVEEVNQFPIFRRHFESFIKSKNKECAECVIPIEKEGKAYYLFSLVTESQLERVLSRIFDPDEFYSPYGVRSLSKAHAEHPFEWNGRKLGYEPGESLERIKGGNSNWRGPVWFPINYILIKALRRYNILLGERVRVRAGGKIWTLDQMADDLSRRLISIFRVSKGKRPYLGDSERQQTDPLFRDHLLFYEHFDGDTGRGLGASHQTGWTALVAKIIEELYDK